MLIIHHLENNSLILQPEEAVNQGHWKVLSKGLLDETDQPGSKDSLPVICAGFPVADGVIM